MIDGVYAKAPFISGVYGWDRQAAIRELPSLVENNGYLGMDGPGMDLMVAMYDPDGRHARDPLAWPYFATRDDLAGLPPHVVTVDELDPLRDEGVAYLRKLTDAGVPARGQLNLGLVHCADLVFRQALSSHYRAAVSDVVTFARALGPWS